MVSVEILAKLRSSGCEVTGRIGLRVRKVEGRSRLDGHVAMGHGALQRQHGRQPMHVSRITFDDRGCLEAEMVVAMRGLSCPARMTTLNCDVI